MKHMLIGIVIGLSFAALVPLVYRYVAPDGYCYATGGHLLGYSNDNQFVCIHHYPDRSAE
jgi:hypothetical protein